MSDQEYLVLWDVGVKCCMNMVYKTEFACTTKPIFITIKTDLTFTVEIRL